MTAASKNIKIKNKLLFGYFAVIFLFFILGIYFVKSTEEISQKSRNVELYNFTAVELIDEIQKNILIINELQNRAGYIDNDAQLRIVKKHADIYCFKVTQLITELESLTKNKTGIFKSVSEIKTLFQEYCALPNQKNLKEEKTLSLDSSPVLKQLAEILNDLHNEEISIFSSELGSIDRLAKKIRYSYACALLIGIILSILIAYKIADIIVKPIMSLVNGMRSIGKGNLDYKIKIKSADEIGILQTGFLEMAALLKIAHDTLQKERDGLEIKVKERTKDLEQSKASLIKTNEELKQIQSQLIQSEKMAAVGLLAGGVAHEINNPLTGVLNTLQLMKLEISAKNSPIQDDFKELLNLIEESALRCKKIVRELLEFSRAGKGALETISINATLEKNIALACHETQLENVELTKELSANCPLVRIDFNRFQQVILNIINNALWALRKMPEKKLKIKTQFSEDKKFAVIEITDNGCGIKKENLAHIFEPFFTTKDVGEGTGLGLSVSFQIIKELNGILEAESEGENKGTTFRIKLPAAT